MKERLTSCCLTKGGISGLLGSLPNVSRSVVQVHPPDLFRAGVSGRVRTGGTLTPAFTEVVQ